MKKLGLLLMILTMVSCEQNAAPKADQDILTSNEELKEIY